MAETPEKMAGSSLAFKFGLSHLCDRRREGRTGLGLAGCDWHDSGTAFYGSHHGDVLIASPALTKISPDGPARQENVIISDFQRSLLHVALV